MNKKEPMESNSQSLDSIIFTSPIRLLVMVLLLKYESITVRDLVKLANTSPGNLDHHINYLMDSNYIEKYPIKSKARLLYSVRLTDKGKEKIQSQIGNLKRIIKEYDL